MCLTTGPIYYHTLLPSILNTDFITVELVTKPPTESSALPCPPAKCPCTSFLVLRANKLALESALNGQRHRVFWAKRAIRP